MSRTTYKVLGQLAPLSIRLYTKPLEGQVPIPYCLSPGLSQTSPMLSDLSIPESDHVLSLLILIKINPMKKKSHYIKEKGSKTAS